MQALHEFQTEHSKRGLLRSDLLLDVLNPEDKLPVTILANYFLLKGIQMNKVIP